MIFQNALHRQLHLHLHLQTVCNLGRNTLELFQQPVQEKHVNDGTQVRHIGLNGDFPKSYSQQITIIVVTQDWVFYLIVIILKSFPEDKQPIFAYFDEFW